MTRLAPVANPMENRHSGEMRMWSNEYFTKNATPRKSASPPIHAKSFAPMNCSQLIGGSEGSGAVSSAGGGWGGTGGETGVAAGRTSCGNGGGTEVGRISENSAGGGETKGSPSAISLFAAGDRFAASSPGGGFYLFHPPS